MAYLLAKGRKSMAYYEMVVLYRQDLSKGQADDHTNKLVEFIEQENGKIARREYWGLRTTAYKIRKNRKAHYILLNFDLDGTHINELDRRMKLNDNIIRHMCVRTDDLPTEDSVMMQQDEHSNRKNYDHHSDDGATENSNDNQDNGEE